ncbi:hypothetical protein DEU56DRAFT_874348 [Suillus clintonianus]|uniref:uncharacterized protein n=1 Tax=Suillus clintonianus TaxID=1904413 RepID=UPI001B872ECB|nr:uncharacterized protein DEU56DRAFT_874348 [Suillus clintonianus]KAG2112875.1 hypothetical protein DEU56DRAFT_874348 [Suillus clintonianus]
MESNLSPPIAGSSSTIVCTEKLRQELGRTTRAKKRQKKVTLNSYPRPKSSVKQRKHTQYQYRGDGSISYTLQYVQPPKNAQQTTHRQPPEPIQPALAMTLDDFGEFSADMSCGADNDAHSERKQDRSLFLHEMLRLEGRGELSAGPCSGCCYPHPEYRCQDCFGITLCCASCMVTAHTHHPLHRLQKWNGEYFESASLKTLGLRIQLGHMAGQTCSNPRRAFNDDFVIMDSHGVHEVALDFCDCSLATTHIQQLLHMSLFPSTTSDPKTAATFRLLEEFHLLSFESKVSAYEFFNALMRRSDNTGLSPIKERYDQFTRMIREWRHLKMLKQSGRPYDPKGVDSTPEGGCAVLCPACPQPGKNLPADWREASPTDRSSWLYGLFVAIDANFRLKRKVVSKDSVDPSLSCGWGYFVEEHAYKAFLDDKSNISQEKSTCSSHNAVNSADTKSSHGLAATGLGTIDCARHNMKLLTAVGDLQKGERYVNMDYLFFSTLRHTAVDILNVLYDIACQWNKHLWHRMASFPPSMQLDHTAKKVTFFVPKFHLPAHIESCQTSFSFNFARSRGWANINPVASSTKEMGPGARRDTLDDFFGDWNWKKITGLRRTMLRKVKEALPELSEHEAALDDLEEGLKVEYAEALSRWKEQVEAWEHDPSQPNPYERSTEKITLASVRLELAKEDTSEIERGGFHELHEDCSPSVLISGGLELEEQQRRLRAEKAGLGIHATDIQEGKVVQRSNSLQRRIEAWVKVQELYMPMIAALRLKNKSSGVVITPESFDLLLPSQVGRTDPFDLKFQKIEWRLRFAQAHDTLRSLRSNLRAQTAILKYKDRNLRGQGSNTRACNTLKGVDARIEAASTRYQDARRALVILAPFVEETGWQASLRPLDRQDIRGMSDVLWGETEGRRKLSWIWNMRSAHGDELDDDGSMEGKLTNLFMHPISPALYPDMRIEWCKARARAMRWKEELELLREEMRRTLQFFDWQAIEGRIAYARRQAALRRALRDTCHSSWADTCSFVDQFHGES